MANPIFDAMGGRMPTMPGPFGQFQNMISQFRQFQSAFQGDPRAKVQELLSSGKMSQQQYNQLAQIAQTFQSMMQK